MKKGKVCCGNCQFQGEVNRELKCDRNIEYCENEYTEEEWETGKQLTRIANLNGDCPYYKKLKE